MSATCPRRVSTTTWSSTPRDGNSNSRRRASCAGPAPAAAATPPTPRNTSYEGAASGFRQRQAGTPITQKWSTTVVHVATIAIERVHEKPEHGRQGTMKVYRGRQNRSGSPAAHNAEQKKRGGLQDCSSPRGYGQPALFATLVLEHQRKRNKDHSEYVYVHLPPFINFLTDGSPTLLSAAYGLRHVSLPATQADTGATGVPGRKERPEGHATPCCGSLGGISPELDAPRVPAGTGANSLMPA
jgi:hypothetical protein